VRHLLGRGPRERRAPDERREMARRPKPSRPVAAVILAAGQGTRMKSSKPKVAFELCGWPMVRHVLETVRALRPAKTVVVVGHGREQVTAALATVPHVTFAVQRKQRGTADAVKAALPSLRGFDGTVLVLCGDVPLVSGETLAALLAAHRRAHADATILSVTLPDGGRYGRIVRGPEGEFVRIVEAKDATSNELGIREINTGLYAFDAHELGSAIQKVGDDNAQGEYYLTDVPEILLAAGARVQAVDAGSPDDVLGVNTFAELAAAASRMRWRILERHMAAGVEVRDPSTTWIDRDVTIGGGTRVLPSTLIEREVTIGRGCEVGPFAHVRPGTVLDDGAEIGNFVETKKARIGRNTKAKHLTYLGDAVIGADTNVGCGTITANYDGKKKHVTVVEDRVHIGSGTVLVAPVRVGKGATTGAGAIVTAGRDVAPGDVVVGVPARSLRRRNAR
jgi:bifunctional UDP-N-acetylglucosamine pyrophosphorylase / glucosamine-1-phosphate N-acetyltransferase